MTHTQECVCSGIFAERCITQSCIFRCSVSRDILNSSVLTLHQYRVCATHKTVSICCDKNTCILIVFPNFVSTNCEFRGVVWVGTSQNVGFSCCDILYTIYHCIIVETMKSISCWSSVFLQVIMFTMYCTCTRVFWCHDEWCFTTYLWISLTFSDTRRGGAAGPKIFLADAGGEK